MEAVADRLDRAHVVEDRRIVANQLALVERLNSSGRDTREAERTLDYPNGSRMESQSPPVRLDDLTRYRMPSPGNRARGARSRMARIRDWRFHNFTRTRNDETPQWQASWRARGQASPNSARTLPLTLNIRGCAMKTPMVEFEREAWRSTEGVR